MTESVENSKAVEETGKESAKRQKMETEQVEDIGTRVAEIDALVKAKQNIRRQCKEDIDALCKERNELMRKKQPFYYGILCSPPDTIPFSRIVGLFSTVDLALRALPNHVNSWTFGVTPISSDKPHLDFSELDNPPKFGFLPRN